MIPPATVRLAALAALASRYAYSVRAEELPGYGLSRIRIVRSTEWHVWLPLVRDSGLPALMAVRGTTDVPDWETDLRALLTGATVNGQPCRVHAGAEDALFSSRYGALPALCQDLARWSGGWVLGGHSLGALVARRLAASLSPVDVRAVHLFGAPRGGDRAYVRAYPHTAVTWEWQIPGDPIPHLPPARPWGYVHLPRLLYLTDTGTAAPAPAYLARCHDLRAHALRGPRHLAARHSVDLYHTRLQTIVLNLPQPQEPTP